MSDYTIDAGGNKSMAPGCLNISAELLAKCQSGDYADNNSYHEKGDAHVTYGRKAGTDCGQTESYGIEKRKDNSTVV